MYPEGWLIDSAGKNLLSFEKDPMNPRHEGFIGFWTITGINSKQFRYRKRTSRDKALSLLFNLPNKGWIELSEKENAA